MNFQCVSRFSNTWLGDQLFNLTYKDYALAALATAGAYIGGIKGVCILTAAAVGFFANKYFSRKIVVADKIYGLSIGLKKHKITYSSEFKKWTIIHDDNNFSFLSDEYQIRYSKKYRVVFN